MIRIEKNNKIDIISFSSSQINALIIEDIRDRFFRVFEVAHSKVIINLAGVKYIDSSGFGFLLSLKKTAGNNYGVLKITHPEPSIKSLFKLLHFHSIFQIYDDLESCINSFR